MDRPLELYELLIAFFSISGIIVAQFLYLRDSVLRHEVEIRHIKDRQEKTDVQFEKITDQLSSILHEISALKVDMVNKANRQS